MSADTGAPIVTAAVLIIGNEILSGRTQDANLAYIAQGLGEAGVVLREARVIPDIPDTIVADVNELRAKFDYVFTTGGIGPTHDDITSECVARAFGLPLTLHPEAHRQFLSYYAPGELNEARLRMAKTPEGATLIPNPISRAPGFRIGNVFVMAGIPRVMQAMFDDVKGELQGRAAGAVAHRELRRAGGAAGQGLGRDPGPLSRSRYRLLSLHPARQLRRGAGAARPRRRRGSIRPRTRSWPSSAASAAPRPRSRIAPSPAWRNG